MSPELRLVFGRFIGRDHHDMIVLRVTDETVPDAGKKRYALSLSIHGIERAGAEGGTRAMEDLVTSYTTGLADKPIVSPHLLKDPDDLRDMMDGQRFFLRAFETEPLKSRTDRVFRPDPARLDDEGLADHCRRMVKTNYHPAGTAKMGADGDPMAVLDARMRVRGIEGLRVADMSACPNINAGNTTAPALMLGSRCADFVMGLE